MKFYTLDGHTPVPVARDNVVTWGRWFETTDRRVAHDSFPGAVTVSVSTVFLGLDHRHVGDGPPLLFETMVFGGPHDQAQLRYATWDEAIAGHARMVRRVMGQ
jgi:hypothetical protein